MGRHTGTPSTRRSSTTPTSLQSYIPWAADGPAGVKVRFLPSAWEDACPVTNLPISSRTHLPCQRPRVLAAILFADRRTLWTSLSANCSSSKLASITTVSSRRQGRRHDPTQSASREAIFFLESTSRARRAHRSVRLTPQFFLGVPSDAGAAEHKLRVALFSSFPLLV